MSSAREQIIRATCELLELQGYYATGLNQIIKESGSPKGSLYHYFPGGKEELTAEALQFAGRIVAERIRENLAAIENAAEAVTLFIQNIAVHVERSGYRAGGPITTVAIETASSSERLRDECRMIYAQWEQLFVDKLMSGGIAQDRARVLAAVIICSIEGGIILARTQRSPQPLELVAQHMGLLVAMLQ